ncbi:hypothetical protein BDV27DRAFT_153152 [Aspergillus caelatus]|uniref:Uncharacterized protein n=1 Tax=Aspergillus caelatus TaxID=61420 RepID=A0A5N7AHD4_9EURO|nr:uncharacterized protein BDV27DRAFT_153152 [Aspergillus caelatus]KAE8369272.1 hypothetical protein BDV27DRAFT_153152 [Aspergillus caelatus]
MKFNLIVFFFFILSLVSASPVAEAHEVDGLEARDADVYEEGLYERDSTVEHFKRTCNQQEPRCESGHWDSKSCKCHGKCAISLTTVANPGTGTGTAANARAEGVTTSSLTAKTGTGIIASAEMSVIKQIITASLGTGIGTAVAAGEKSETTSSLTAKTGTGIIASAEMSVIKQIITASLGTGIGTAVAAGAKGATTSSLTAITGTGIVASAGTRPSAVLLCFKHPKLTKGLLLGAALLAMLRPIEGLLFSEVLGMEVGKA